MPALCLTADCISPPPHPILPLPSAAQIPVAGIAAADAHEIDSIAQLFSLSSGYVNYPELVAPYIEPVADPSKGTGHTDTNMMNHFKRKGTQAKPGPSDVDYLYK